MSKLKKGLLFTDIHFGKKSNSPLHNQDCLDFIDWVCQIIEEEGDIDYIAFLGDWHENRSSLNVFTQDFSYKGAEKLNSLGLPVYFIIGNHDMGLRHSRDVYSTISFNAFENFIVVDDEPLIVEDIYGGCVFMPFLLHDEYEELAEYTPYPVWMGHFEFKGFVLTGQNHVMERGPSIESFKPIKRIFSGHFHKRQSQKNTHYIGNTFPMDFSDANDFERGCAIYDHVNDTLEYRNWDACPKYIRGKLSEVLDGEVDLLPNSYVQLEADFQITYEEVTKLKPALIQANDLRGLDIDEKTKFSEALEGEEQDSEEVERDENGNLKSSNELIIEMLRQNAVETFDTDMLVDIWSGLED